MPAPLPGRPWSSTEHLCPLRDTLHLCRGEDWDPTAALPCAPSWTCPIQIHTGLNLNTLVYFDLKLLQLVFQPRSSKKKKIYLISCPCPILAYWPTPPPGPLLLKGLWDPAISCKPCGCSAMPGAAEQGTRCPSSPQLQTAGLL